MINWTDEDVEFIVRQMVMPCIQETVKLIEDKDKISYETFNKIFTLISDQIAEIRYERIRDKDFMIMMLENLMSIDVGGTYKRYCEDYDKLNRHVLDDTKDDDKNEL